MKQKPLDRAKMLALYLAQEPLGASLQDIIKDLNFTKQQAKAAIKRLLDAKAALQTGEKYLLHSELRGIYE